MKEDDRGSGEARTEKKIWREVLLGLLSKNEDKKINQILYFPPQSYALLSFLSLIFAFLP